MVGRILLIVAILAVNILSIRARKLWGQTSSLSLKSSDNAFDIIGRADIGDDSNSISSSGNSKGVQIMITKKMRRVLIDDLEYLEEEVDNMEPQIAAVLIDRKLSRPKKGVPSSWLKPSAKRRQLNGQFSSLLQHFGEKGANLLNFGRSYIVPLLPYAALGSILFFQRGLIMHIAGASLQSLQEVKSRVANSFQPSDDEYGNGGGETEGNTVDKNERDEGVTRPRFGGTIRIPSGDRVSASSSQDAVQQRAKKGAPTRPEREGRVNIRSYEQVRRGSMWDQWVIQSGGWRKKHGL